MGHTKIANSSQAAAQGDSPSLETTLAFAEQRREMLEAELGQLDGSQQPAVVQFSPAALERHLQGMTEKLRSGVNGKVREAIQQSIARILVGVDGNLTIEAKPGGLLGLEGHLGQVGDREDPTLFAPVSLSTAGREWTLIGAGRPLLGVIASKYHALSEKALGLGCSVRVRFGSLSRP